MATQVTVISDCSSILGSMGPRAHNRYLIQVVGAIVHARWVQHGLWRGSFLVKNPCLRGTPWRIVGFQYHPSGYDFRMRWLLGIDRAKGACPTYSFGDRGYARCSMGPKQSLEGVLFCLKPLRLRGVKRYVLGLHCHSSGCNFWLEWLVLIDKSRNTSQTSSFIDGGHTRCPMDPKRSLESVIFSLKSPCLRRVQPHVLVLQCHQSSCNFR